MKRPIIFQTCIIFATLMSAFSATDRSAEYSYYDQDAWPYWPSAEVSECGGKKQSPIQIDPDTKTDPTLHPIKFENYDKARTLHVSNDGYHLKIKLTDADIAAGKDLPAIKGGCTKGYGKKYRFYTAVLHWGNSVHDGSEHRICGKHYGGELQLFHYDAHKYESFEEAIASGDKKAVVALAYFLKLSKTGLAAWTKILDLIKPDGNWDSIKTPGQTTIDDVKLSELLPYPKAKEYFTYKGSITYPTCMEGVQWYVFKKPIPFTEHQFEDLYMMVNENDEPLAPNYRYTQKLNKRKVRAYRIHGYGHGPRRGHSGPRPHGKGHGPRRGHPGPRPYGKGRGHGRKRPRGKYPFRARKGHYRGRSRW